jgi:hypothetical protein
LSGYLVDLVHLVSFVQPKNQTDQTNQTTVFLCWRTFPASYNGTMPIRISRQSDYLDIVEKSLNRHDNHRGICGPVSRTMPVSIFNS